MTQRIKEKTAFERDLDWLAENHYSNLDCNKFSDWVTRMFDDGFSEIEARTYVLKKMLNEKS
jgi:hypothetical protein